MYFNQDNTSSHIKFTPGKESQYRSQDVDAKPTGNPKSGKDFKKILGKDSDKEEEEKTVAETVTDDKETEIAEAKPKMAASIFDLTAGKAASTSMIEKSIAESQSPNLLFGKLSSKKGVDEGDTLAEAETNLTTKKEKFTTRFDTEQLDLSYINPLANQQTINTITPIQQKEIIPPSHIQDIIDQLVKKVAAMEVEGRTDTTVTLKQPPLFEGVNLVVSAFDNAKGEFNIAFENLTQAAKQLLDMRVNQESLRAALEQKGYAVHIITTTTLIEHPIIATQTSESGKEGGKGTQQDKQREERRPR